VLECSWVRRALGARRHCFFLAVLPPPLPGRRQRDSSNALRLVLRLCNSYSVYVPEKIGVTLMSCQSFFLAWDLLSNNTRF